MSELSGRMRSERCELSAGFYVCEGVPVKVTVFFSGYLGGEWGQEGARRATYVDLGSFGLDNGYGALFMTGEVTSGLDD